MAKLALDHTQGTDQVHGLIPICLIYTSNNKT
ncbi:MAG: hypothetical protein ACI9LE_002076 [Paraglaciecola sp.]|jgi:hypothetical protein